MATALIARRRRLRRRRLIMAVAEAVLTRATMAATRPTDKQRVAETLAVAVAAIRCGVYKGGACGAKALRQRR